MTNLENEHSDMLLTRKAHGVAMGSHGSAVGFPACKYKSRGTNRDL
jgi:hypothetical protein